MVKLSNRLTAVIEGKTILVVVPCYNEEVLIAKVLKGLPDFIDEICVVDDCSSDNTVNIVNGIIEENIKNITLLEHKKNEGVGGSIATGYKYALKKGYDCTVVMAGDAQMDPEDLPAILEPVISDKAEYSKGNRLFSGDAWEMIPRVRYIGNSLLSLLTKVASGYWHIADSQSGYTAISYKAIKAINWDEMYKRYGQPNDLLVRLNINNFRVVDVPIKPIYGVGEKSGIKPIRMIPKLAFLILKLFLFRLLHKYVIRDFHPLVFFYFFGLLLLPLGTIFGFYLFGYRIFVGPIAETSALFAAFLFIAGMQFTLFAMWFDMENNKDLK